MVKAISPNTAVACCLSLTGVVLCGTPSAQARVTQVVITATESPTFGGKSFGAVGQYERVSGQIVGEVDPKNPVNAVIVDIDLAPKNPNSTVTYSTDFQILRPIDRTKGNKRLIYEITNRGRTNVLKTLNDSKTGNDTATSGDAGNGFLMRQGYIVLESSWDFSAPRNGKLFTATVPVAKNPDGSSITGPTPRNSSSTRRRRRHRSASTIRPQALINRRRASRCAGTTPTRRSRWRRPTGAMSMRN
jgi:hypothetical protein